MYAKLRVIINKFDQQVLENSQYFDLLSKVTENDQYVKLYNMYYDLVDKMENNSENNIECLHTDINLDDDDNLYNNLKGPYYIDLINMNDNDKSIFIPRQQPHSSTKWSRYIVKKIKT